jgi:ribonucrease Y
MREIEDFIKEKEGVNDVAVLQAGREIRVVVNPKEMTDDQTVVFIAKLREELAKYFSNIPGQMKITAIREFRTTETTRK